MANIGSTIAKAQITNGGPVILVQPENEYTYTESQGPPSPGYFEAIIQLLRHAGIVVPLISNDASPQGNDAPGTPEPADIYGYDGYPLGFDCSDPTVWPEGSLPTDYRQLHLQQSPTTPNSIVEVCHRFVFPSFAS